MIYILLAIMLVLITIAVAGWSLAPFVPTRTRDLRRILKLANLKKGQKFYDLGCGNGKVAVHAAKNSEAEAVGIEMALPIYVWAKSRQLLLKIKNLKVLYGSFYKIDLSDADVIYVFGFPATMKRKFCRKLKADLKPGAKIISYFFKIPDLKLEKVDWPDKNRAPIYVYKI